MTVTTARKTYYAAKYETVEKRKLSSALNQGKPLAQFSILKTRHRGAGRKRLATVAASGLNFNYYDPATSISKVLRDELSAPLPHEPRHVDPTTVECTSLSDIKRTKLGEAGGGSFQKKAWRRMRRIAGRYIRCWCARHDRYGMYFLFSEKVIYQTWSFKSGWSSCRVPEEGLDIAGDGR